MTHSPIDSIVNAAASTPWLILPEKLDEILGFLALRAKGVVFSPAEIQARIGDQAPRSGTVSTPNSIAVIPVVGVIAQRASVMNNLSSGGGVSTIAVGQAFQQALDSPEVRAIVLDVDSPGGTVQGVAELADQIYRARGRKPIVADANGLAVLDRVRGRRSRSEPLLACGDHRRVHRARGPQRGR